MDLNASALSAGALSSLALIAHAVGGGREVRFVVPIDATAKAHEVRQQMINGWHWVSVDLALASAVFLLVAGTDVLADERAVLSGLSCYFAIVGVVWLATTAIGTRMRPKLMLRLGQWLLCFLLSALAWFAR